MFSLGRKTITATVFFIDFDFRQFPNTNMILYCYRRNTIRHCDTSYTSSFVAYVNVRLESYRKQ